MVKLVYIGGFSGRSPRDAMCDALLETFNVDDLDAFTFAEAMKHPDEVRRALVGALAVTHSAGVLALRGTAPTEAHIFNPPFPRSPWALASRLTWLKTRGMFTRGYREYGAAGLGAAARFSGASVAELALHPVGNFSHLPEIAKTDGFEEATALLHGDIPAVTIHTDHDEYFPLPPDKANVPSGLKVRELHGEHDEIILRPYDLLRQYARS